MTRDFSNANTISRAYLPSLIPVEVEESKAKQWFRFLLSAVEFLHKRGVVHNDIKCVIQLNLRQRCPDTRLDTLM